ncbi:hypothetical protein LOAG_16775 [Loa loa]|uniref:Anaphase-promoting complex subunit 13 n=1 Tax=Loa loa TaxID=7209 RepID=A0A1I7V5P4_LOALO|nr:hypothetical protein LOAG_16775 [Loa loa]EJD76247.1 hypothetical protein LOAG_16775 [Loa loa]
MAFKIDDELINMIGDFANMNRSPDFKVKTTENQQKIARTRIGRQHSLNLAVGVSDEIPPFSEVNTATRRQSTGKLLHPTHLINKHNFPAPTHMKEDNEQIRKRHGKAGNYSLLKDTNIGNEESDLEELAEEEIDLLASRTNNETGSVKNYKEALMNDNDGDDNDNDNTSTNSTILSPLSLHTKIINNMGHRGSIILIDDNDDDNNNAGHDRP